jgi:hypothetical protein
MGRQTGLEPGHEDLVARGENALHDAVKGRVVREGARHEIDAVHHAAAFGGKPVRDHQAAPANVHHRVKTGRIEDNELRPPCAAAWN